MQDRVVVGAILLVLLVTGPAVGFDVTDAPPDIGEGTANVTVIEPREGPLYVTPGRFGTDIQYLRVPDLVAEVTATEGGTSRLVYEVVVPELGVEVRGFASIEDTGRVHVAIPDRELSGVSPGQYRGYLAVHVQSYGTYRTVLNRSVRVEVRTP